MHCILIAFCERSHELIQARYICEAFSSFHMQFYQTKLRDGKLVRQKSKRLCAKDRKHRLGYLEASAIYCVMN